MTSLRERVFFEIGDESVIGDLHRPADPGPHPVVVAGPMTSLKEQVAGVHVSALAVRGFAALAINHRYFGESGGVPRRFEDPARKIEDLAAAFDWLGSQPAVDAGRRGLVGVCRGASYAAGASDSTSAARALGNAARYFPDPVTMRANDPTGFDAEIETECVARRAFERNGTVDLVAAAWDRIRTGGLDPAAGDICSPTEGDIHG